MVQIGGVYRNIWAVAIAIFLHPTEDYGPPFIGENGKGVELTVCGSAHSARNDRVAMIAFSRSRAILHPALYFSDLFAAENLPSNIRCG